MVTQWVNGLLGLSVVPYRRQQQPCLGDYRPCGEGPVKQARDPTGSIWLLQALNSNEGRSYPGNRLVHMLSPGH